MSSNRNRNIRNSLMGVAGITAATLLFVGTGSTGADFTDSDTGTYSVSTGTLDLELSDTDNSDTFELKFENLVPGESKIDRFTVTNAGSVPMDVKLGSPYSNQMANLPADTSALKVSIDGYQTAIPFSQFDTVQLGSLNPGKSRTYKLNVSLDQSAGNEWQGKSASGTVTVTGSQQ